MYIMNCNSQHYAQSFLPRSGRGGMRVLEEISVGDAPRLGDARVCCGVCVLSFTLSVSRAVSDVLMFGVCSGSEAPPPLIAPIDALTTAVYNTYLMHILQYFVCLNDTHCLTQHHPPAIEIS